MAFEQTWQGGASATGEDANSWAEANNWKPVSIRSADFQWTASGSGTNEYYLEAAGGGDPGIDNEPGKSLADGSELTPGSAGSLAAGEWDWADNDTLGFSTVYVRLSDGADPDSKAAGFVTATILPQDGDEVVITAPGGGTHYAITAGLDQSGVTLGSLRIDQSYEGSGIGTAAAYLRIGATDVVIGADYADSDGQGSQRVKLDLGTAAAYLRIGATDVVIGADYADSDGQGSQRVKLDLGAAATTVQILDSAVQGNPASQKPIQLLMNNGASKVFARRGNFSIAAEHGETATLGVLDIGYTSNQQSDVSCLIGDGVTLNTTGDELEMEGGEVVCLASVTTATVRGGRLTTEGGGTIGTLEVHGGTVVSNSTGTVTLINARGGEVSFERSRAERTVTTLKVWSGAVLRGVGREYLTLTNDPQLQEGVVLAAT